MQTIPFVDYFIFVEYGYCWREWKSDLIPLNFTKPEDFFFYYNLSLPGPQVNLADPKQLLLSFIYITNPNHIYDVTQC